MLLWSVALQACARWLHFTGYALAFGPIAFAVLVMPAPARPAPEQRQRLRRLCHIGIILLLIAAPARFITEADGGGIPTMALRVGAALLLWAFEGALELAGADQEWPLLMLAVALAVVDGHAGVTSVHLAAMGLWTGGLASLLGLWSTLGPARAEAVARFGRLAALAVTTLAATGALMAAAHLATAGQLVTTVWGRLLIAKLVGVAIALVLAQSRRWRGELWVQTLILALAALLATVPSPR